MCGVFGWYLHRGELSQKQVDAARAATTSMAHRGPDNQGEWTGRNVYLGHRRLGIIDLSAAANQPFVDDQGGVLIFNGEIYNYIELRAELEKLGHAFRTKSDTEVVVAAIRQWDLSAFNRFDGMFAGSWHDPKTNRHVLFRDPLGQKPLYWHSTGAEILYASELGALLALPDRQWRLDRAAFQRFVANSY